MSYPKLMQWIQSACAAAEVLLNQSLLFLILLSGVWVRCVSWPIKYSNKVVSKPFGGFSTVGRCCVLLKKEFGITVTCSKILSHVDGCVDFGLSKTQLTSKRQHKQMTWHLKSSDWKTFTGLQTPGFWASPLFSKRKCANWTVLVPFIPGKMLYRRCHWLRRGLILGKYMNEVLDAYFVSKEPDFIVIVKVVFNSFSTADLRVFQSFL